MVDSEKDASSSSTNEGYDAYFRRPGMIERFYICLQHHKLYTNYAMSVQYNRPVTKAFLSNALKQVIQEHSVFTLGLKKTGSKRDKSCKNFLVGPVNEIVFENVVEYVDRPFCEAELQGLNERDCPISDQQVTWRVVVFSNNYVSFYNNHLFFDGESGVHFHEDLCRALESVSEEAEFIRTLYDVDACEFQPHLPASDITTICDTSLPFFIHQALLEYLPSRLARVYQFLTTEGYPPFNASFFVSKHEKSSKTNFKQLKVPPEKVNRLLDVCRSYGFTMTAFLDVVLRYCFQQTILPHRSKKSLSFESSIVMSGRRYFPELARQTRYNYLVTGKSITLPPVKDFSNATVVPKMKLVKRHIDRELKDRTSYQLFGLLKYFSPYGILDPKDKTVKSRTLYEVSNLGFKTIQCGKWAAEDILFSQCVGTIVTTGFSIVTTNKGMNVVFGYPDDFIGAPIEDFSECFNSTIDQFISQN